MVRMRGFGSFARRSPRSKVYGVGFWTRTGNFEGPALVSAIFGKNRGC